MVAVPKKKKKKRKKKKLPHGPVTPFLGYPKEIKPDLEEISTLYVSVQHYSQ